MTQYVTQAQVAALNTLLTAALEVLKTPNVTSGVATPPAIKTRGNQNYLEADLNSSNLARVKYWKNTKTLRVTFHNGSEYDYSNVPLNVVEGLIRAPSAGSFHNANIKGVYGYVRV